MTGARLLNDAPVADGDESIGDQRRRRVVADDDRRGADLAYQLAQERVDAGGVVGIELAGGLVGEQDAWPVRNGGADCHPLLFSAGKPARLLVCPVEEPHPIQQERGPVPAALRRGTGQLELERDAVTAGEVGRQRARVVLVEEADVGGPERRRRGAVEAPEVDVERASRSRREPVERGEHAEQR